MIRPDLSDVRTRSEPKLIRVCVACSLPLFRAGVRQALHSTSDIHVVVEAHDSGDVLRAVEQARPAVLLLEADIEDGGSGVMLRRLDQQGQFPGIVIMLGSDLTEFSKLDRGGTLSCVTLSDEADEFIYAIRSAARGEEYRSEAARLALHQSLTEAKVYPRGADSVLTPTEMQILGYLELGRTSREIAEDLFISHRTVQKHRANIAGKLGLSGSNALLAYALRRGQSAR